MLQGFFGPHAVGRVLGRCDGEFAQTAILEGGCQVFEFGVGFERTAFGDHDADAAAGIQAATIGGLASVGQPEHKVFVGRHEQVKRRALLDLGIKIPRRPKYQPQPLPRGPGETLGHFFDSKFQVGRRCHRG